VEKGIKNPDPIKLFYKDLSTEIKKWTHDGCKIILMLDANEPLREQPGGLGHLVGENSLVDLSEKILHDKTNVSTYARGTKKIDFIFGTKQVEKFCIESGIVPFGFGYPSNHRALFIQVNIGEILNTTVTTVESWLARKLQNATPKECTIFLEAVHKHYEQQNLFERMRKRDIELTNGQPRIWKSLKNATSNT
jgi:hypothetical protein